MWDAIESKQIRPVKWSERFGWSIEQLQGRNWRIKNANRDERCRPEIGWEGERIVKTNQIIIVLGWRIEFR